MRIDIYTLLGLVKDGKAPKKILYNNIELEYDKDTKDYHPYYGKYLFEFKFADCVDFLEDEVEIIKEDKKIEKITVREKTLGFPNGEWTARNMDKALAIKINELIDEISKLKEK